MAKNRLIILDRDGVINQDSDAFVKSADEWIPIPGSIEAIAALSKAGFRVVIATNQSGVGRGLFSLDTLAAMHKKLVSLVENAGGTIAGIFYCPHTPEDGCACRKPLPGLFDAIAETFGAVANAPTIGDSLRDLEAGLARDCLPVLVRTGKGANTEAKIHRDNLTIPGLRIYDDLAAAVADLVTQHA